MKAEVMTPRVGDVWLLTDADLETGNYGNQFTETNL